MEQIDVVERLKTFMEFDCYGLTWYWARYSWANYAVDLDIPKDIISEALGHKHGSNVTGIYIKYSLNKIDAANRRVIDYLQEK